MKVETERNWVELVVVWQEFSFSFIEFKGFPRQDLRSPDRGDLRNGFVIVNLIKTSDV